MNKLLRRGNRAFTVASLLTIAISIAHLTGLTNEPFNEDWAVAFEAMQNATVDIGPMTMSFDGLLLGLWLQVGLLLALLGVKNLALLLVLPEETSHNVIRTLSIVDCIGYAGLAVIFLVVVIPPALISFIILTVVYLVTAIRSGQPSSQ
jgi:hypothetical protein